MCWFGQKKFGRMNMSVKIYPYLAEPGSLIPEAAASGAKPSGAAEDITSFQEILKDADRSLRAMAVDALIAQSETGSVDVATVQKLFGFNPAPASVAANSKQSSGAAAADQAGGTDKTDSSAGSADRAGGAGASGSAADSTGICTPELEKYFAEAAALYSVDVNLLKAIAKAESNFNASATSGAGAMGIMQLMPDTISGLGITDAYDAHDNIMGGAKLIAEYIERYNGDLSMALAAYNAGPGNVDKYNGIPPFEETQSYVRKVMDYYINA